MPEQAAMHDIDPFSGSQLVIKQSTVQANCSAARAGLQHSNPPCAGPDMLFKQVVPWHSCNAVDS